MSAKRRKSAHHMGDVATPGAPVAGDVSTARTPPAEAERAKGRKRERLAKALCDYATRTGRATWPQARWEEFAAALGAPDDPSRRDDLIHLAARSLTWAGAVDRQLANSSDKNTKGEVR